MWTPSKKILAVATTYLVVQHASCQATALSQNTTFNSTVSLNASQISQYQLNDTWAAAVDLALQFEHTNWATGSVHSDPFYAVPANSSGATPGALLKVQEFVNTTTFTVSPNVAMSRFMFQTETFNGSSVPASAFVLWPYNPQQFNMTGVGKIPMIAWAHGTSGQSAECAPSHIRNLWYQYAGLFELAIQGYAVVAPDYAGLGINTDANGNHIYHQYIASPAAANDLAHAVQAAQTAWPELSKEFVVMGHSQGGGSAWGFAQRQAQRPIDGYLGTIASNPTTSTIAEANVQLTVQGVIPEIAQGVATIFPDFQLSDWLTPRGEMNINLMQEIEGCNSVSGELFGGFQNFKPEWNETWYAKQWDQLMGNGGRPFAGPLMVLIGTKDTNRPITVTDPAVKRTCEMFPQNSLQYYIFNGSQHVPTLFAGQRIWFDWIADRFSGVQEPPGCQNTTITPPRPVDNYQQNANYFLEYPLYAYENT